MSFSADPPATAAWQHQEARSGFEVACFVVLDEGYRICGCTTAVQDGQSWTVDYTITLDATWTSRSARVTGRSVTGVHSVVLQADGAGRWLVDGEAAPRLDGCLDVDLESSAMTNALPVHRMSLPVDARAAAPAAYVRVPDLSVERLEQEYVRMTDEDSYQRYDYTAPSFAFNSQLVYDTSGLVLAYPGIAVRAA
ncbi:MAG: hypothetical protein DLM59_09400 [Pseudonocardiales bacterium]|nr:MAG: hypothetical protein DLM59_09400 [Pseudonocardiales bacterium]